MVIFEGVALDNPNLPPNTDTKPPEQPAVTDAVDISQPLKVARDQCVSNFERRYLEELLHELHHTDTLDYKEMLRRKIAVVESVRSKLTTARPSGPS